MSTTDTRPPPSQFAAKLRRALGGKAGWKGFALQILFVAVLVWLGYQIVAKARDNLQNQRIASGFGFLRNSAGFDISQTLISYSTTDTYLRVFWIGVLNTLLVAVIGIFFATVIGFIVALGRLSPNWLMSRVAGAYVEIIRNLPVLFQILFWYLAVLGALPNPRQSISIFGSFLLDGHVPLFFQPIASIFGSVFLNNRGLFIPKPIADPGFDPFAIAVLIAIIASVGLRSYARRQLFVHGRMLVIWPYVLGLVVGLPLIN